MEIGAIVKVEFDISDPKGMQGQIGKVIKTADTEYGDTIVTVLFDNATKGLYYENCLILIK